MDYVNTLLTSSDANNFFGTDSRLCDSEILESTLRYIAIKSNGGDIETAHLIKTAEREAAYEAVGDLYAGEAFDGTELLIVTPRSRGDGLLAIDTDGWVSLDSPPYPVAALLSAKASETRVYVNATKKRAVIFVKTPTEKWCDLFASCLFRVLPWRFNNDEDAVALAKAITQNRPEEFQKIINACCQSFNFAEQVMKRALLGWESTQRNVQMRQLRTTMDDCLENIRQSEQRIAQNLETYNAASENYNALLKGAGGDDAAFYNFFSNHKQLSVYRISSVPAGKALDYCVLETIEYYDEDNFMNNYNTPTSHIGGCGDDMRRILYGIFKEHKGVIRAEAIFRLTNLSSLTVVRRGRTGKHNKTHLNHPHLVNYGCLGGNESQINRYMLNGDWDMAIEQSIAAVKNVNMGDATVIESMIEDLFDAMDSCACIVANNGQEMTPRQFLQYLHGLDQNEDTSNG